MTPITFRVVGEPKAQPRPRAFAKRFGDKFSARVYTPGTAEAWKGEIARQAEPHNPGAPFNGALAVSLAFLFTRPACHYGTGKNCERLKPAAPADHVCKPDTDNLAKAAVDCLMQIGFFRDDGQITTLIVTKKWASRDERPGVEIAIFPQETEAGAVRPAQGPTHLEGLKDTRSDKSLSSRFTRSPIGASPDVNLFAGEDFDRTAPAHVSGSSL